MNIKMNKLMVIIILSIILVLTVVLSGYMLWNKQTDSDVDPAPETYTNPVFGPVFADPSIIRAQDGLFYVYGTEADLRDGEGQRLIPILKSSDLVNWEIAGEAFETKPEWKDDGGLWAPDISYFNGKYYLYYAVSISFDPNPGIGVAVSDNPSGPFIDNGKLLMSKEIDVANSIDPMMFVDEGTPYLFWGSFAGIYGIELSSDGLHTVGEKFQIAGSYFEAPYIIKRDGYYYFFGSNGSCCDFENSTYWVTAARSEKLTGPYVDKEGNEIIYEHGTPVVVGMFMSEEEKKFVGPGHNSVIQDDRGTDWFVYHAIDAGDPRYFDGSNKRQLMIDPIIWENGWPKLKNLFPSTGPQEVPFFNK
jgi:arabinan endo-1,5-alpha-L-arabinosidase